MCRRIIKIKRSTLGTNIVVRSPISRRWLFNITIAPKRETLEIETTFPNVLAKIGYAFTLCAIALLFLGACSPTTSEPDDGLVGWYSDYTVDQLMGDGVAYMAGPDTLLYVTDPVITYSITVFDRYEGRPIPQKKVLYTNVFVLQNGKEYPVPCYYDSLVNTVRVYNDEIYEATPIPIHLSDIVRFDIVMEAVK